VVTDVADILAGGFGTGRGLGPGVGVVDGGGTRCVGFLGGEADELVADARCKAFEEIGDS